MSDVPSVRELLEGCKAIGPQLHLIIWGLGLLCLDFLIPARWKSLNALFALIALMIASLQLYLLYLGAQTFLSTK